MCVCVVVSLRNDFLRNNGAIQAKPNTTKRYTQVLNQRNAKVCVLNVKQKQEWIMSTPLRLIKSPEVASMNMDCIGGKGVKRC